LGFKHVPQFYQRSKSEGCISLAQNSLDRMAFTALSSLLTSTTLWWEMEMDILRVERIYTSQHMCTIMGAR